MVLCGPFVKACGVLPEAMTCAVFVSLRQNGKPFWQRGKPFWQSTRELYTAQFPTYYTKPEKVWGRFHTSEDNMNPHDMK
jgi:hypothetical protein